MPLGCGSVSSLARGCVGRKASNAFGEFAKGQDFIKISDLKEVLMTLGEPLSQSEVRRSQNVKYVVSYHEEKRRSYQVDQFIKEMDPEGKGKISKACFVDMVRSHFILAVSP
eukprot:SAG31_NODE_5583_length_2442_cov_3.518993_1_plen_112_part_00